MFTVKIKIDLRNILRIQHTSLYYRKCARAVILIKKHLSEKNIHEEINVLYRLLVLVKTYIRIMLNVGMSIIKRSQLLCGVRTV